MIAQINCTNESCKTIAQDKMTSCPRMEMMIDAFGCSRATQVHMEDLRLAKLTENIQVKGMNKLKLLVNVLDGQKCESTIKHKLLTKENLLLLFDSTTKQARTAPTWGIEAGALNR